MRFSISGSLDRLGRSGVDGGNMDYEHRLVLVFVDALYREMDAAAGSGRAATFRVCKVRKFGHFVVSGVMGVGSTSRANSVGGAECRLAKD